jgi:hypothetical protein
MESGRLFFPRETLKLGLLTALFDYCARFRKLDKDDVAEALLSIVRDGHRSDTGLIVILDHLVIFCVSFRWGKPRCETQDSFTLLAQNTH